MSGMHKVSELVGKAIVSAESGERIGNVADVLLDPHARQVIGLVVGGGILSAEHVLPYADVQTLGKDAVIARSATGVASASEWRQQGADVTRASTLKRRRVLTTTGRALGEVHDVVLDDAGRVEAFQIAGGGLMQKRSSLLQASGVTVGPDAVVVPDETAAPTQD